eukprot:TRINITY_DN1260_c0_g1_i4.p1 TRINITY_DN1260_c0_g1~~TRINITY_DN1260_c0_g1_i4.p1  ORF type:complete len:389 (+),score=38.42 TRINITY_DN1260_c0_g1_i4:20-1186(+)
MASMKLYILSLIFFCIFTVLCFSIVLLQKEKSKQVCNHNTAVEKKYKLHHVFTTDCSEFHDWQSVGMIESWLNLNKPHNLTRIISCDEHPLPDRIIRMKEAYPEVNFVQVKTAQGFKGDTMPELNKPTAVYQWLLQENINEDYVLVTDCDLVLLEPWDIRGVALGTPLAAYGITTYLVRPGAQYSGLCGTHCVNKTNDYFKGFDLGHVYVAHKDDMLRLSKLWTDFSLTIRNTFSDKGGRMVDMFGYQLAALTLELPHKIRMYFDLSHPNDPKTDYITHFQAFHYCQRLEGKGGAWTKYEWRNKGLLDCNGTSYMPLPDVSSWTPEDYFSTRITVSQYHFKLVTILNKAFAAYKKRICKSFPNLPFSLATVVPDKSVYSAVDSSLYST